MPETVSHTTSGSNRVLFVEVRGSTTDVVTGATYNSVSMGLVGKTHSGAGTNSWVYLFYLANPASGTHDIVVSGSTSDTVVVLGTSYTGASQGSLDNSTTATTSGTSLTTNITTVADNCWTILAAQSDNDGLTPGTGSNLVNSGVNTTTRTYDSNGVITPAGATSMDVSSNAGSNGIATVIASFAPAAATNTSGFFMAAAR